MRGDNESLHRGVSHKPRRPDFRKNKSDHKNKYEAQEKVGRCKKNEVRVHETIYRLRNASRYCEFEKLGQEEQTTEEDLIQLRLI